MKFDFEEQLTMKRINIEGINQVNNLSEAEQIKIVENFGFDISLINDPSEKVQLAAVKLDGYYIRFIKNPSEKAQLEAVKNFPHILNELSFYIKNPCQEVLDLAMIKDIIE